MTVLALVLVVVIAIVYLAVCYTQGMPAAIHEANLRTLTAAKATLGQPSREIVAPMDAIAGHELFGVQMPSTLSAPVTEPLRVTVWEHHCFLLGFKRLVVVSAADNRTLFVGGIAKNFFPTVIIRNAVK
ncbi:MAG TPA: hypothetical protein VG323_15740 [Thermoanaerobaculia bacterium]|nr:hypothetical protein [Thermoanaerobaculia bacterium]